MSDFDFDMDGLASLREEFNDQIEDWSGGGSMVVGTSVEYAVYVEFGTSKMDPRPFFRPALTEAEADLEGFIEDNTRKRVEGISSARELVRTVAFALERQVKEIITEKGLIDTGTMRASVQAVETTGELPSADEVDPDASTEVEI